MVTKVSQRKMNVLMKFPPIDRGGERLYLSDSSQKVILKIIFNLENILFSSWKKLSINFFSSKLSQRPKFCIVSLQIQASWYPDVREGYLWPRIRNIKAWSIFYILAHSIEDFWLFQNLGKNITEWNWATTTSIELKWYLQNPVCQQEIITIRGRVMSWFLALPKLKKISHLVYSKSVFTSRSLQTIGVIGYEIVVLKRYTHAEPILSLAHWKRR